MPEIILIFALFLFLLIIFIVVRREISNFKIEFTQTLQGTLQNVNAQVQLLTTHVNESTSQLNQRLDNTISYLSNQVNQTMSQFNVSITNVISALSQQLGQSTNTMHQRLDNATRVFNELREQMGVLKTATDEIKIIGQSISKLEDLLKAPKIRGEIGEFMLENMLREILPEGFYQTQYAFKNRKRVDAIIKINDRILPIDSKFPLDSYRKMVESKDDAQRRALQREFIKDVKNRVDEIAGSYILPDEGTFDFAMMFIPSESVYYEIITMRGDEDIYEYMLRKRVIPVSPSSFYMQLKVFSIGFRAMQVERNAKKIMDLLTRLSDEFEKIANDFRILGGHIRNAQSKYEEINTSMNRFKDSFNNAVSRGIVGDEV